MTNKQRRFCREQNLKICFGGDLLYLDSGSKSSSPLHLFSAIVSMDVLPLTRPKRALQPSRFHIRLKCAIQQEELLTLRVRRRARHVINSDSGAPFSALMRSTRCTRRLWSPVSSLLVGRVGLGNGEYLVGVGKSSEVVRSWEGGEVLREQPSWNIWQFSTQ